MVRADDAGAYVGWGAMNSNMDCSAQWPACKVFTLTNPLQWHIGISSHRGCVTGTPACKCPRRTTNIPTLKLRMTSISGLDTQRRTAACSSPRTSLRPDLFPSRPPFLPRNRQRTQHQLARTQTLHIGGYGVRHDARVRIAIDDPNGGDVFGGTFSDGTEVFGRVEKDGQVWEVGFGRHGFDAKAVHQYYPKLQKLPMHVFSIDLCGAVIEI